MDKLLESHVKSAEVLGFWEEYYRGQVIHWMECVFDKEILRDYNISSFQVTGDRVLVKWTKRYRPLTDEELLDKYGFSSTESKEGK